MSDSVDQWDDIADEYAAERADDRADEFARMQREAFVAGFHAATKESETFRELRRFLEAERDDAADRRHGEDDQMADAATGEYYAYVSVLVKLSMMGATRAPDRDDAEAGADRNDADWVRESVVTDARENVVTAASGAWLARPVEETDRIDVYRFDHAVDTSTDADDTSYTEE